MSNFDHILNWRLLSGSHEFPGPDGGTCINEAAIIAAGFEYREVRSADDCPPCFSPPLAAYLIGINDCLPDEERQKLMRFVLRLSGSADTPGIERRREEHICLETIRRVLPLALRAAGLNENADLCAASPDLEEGEKRAAGAARAAWAARAARAACAARAAGAARAAKAAWAARAAEAELSAIVIAIAEEAFAIGKQAEACDIAIISTRMERAKAPPAEAEAA